MSIKSTSVVCAVEKPVFREGGTLWLCLPWLSTMENKGVYPTNSGKKKKKEVIQVVVNGNRVQ